MNERQKEVLASQLKDEQRVLKELKQVYTKAREDVISNIKALEARTDIENLRAIVYQKNYQEALKKQLDAILDAMNAKQFTTISDYLGKSYEESFLGVLYDLHGQGIPLIFPIDQEQAARAIQIDSKISEGLYQRLGVDTKLLKNAIRANVSRGIASSTSWAQVARNIQNRMNVGMNRAIRIARTEGHRIQNESRFDAQTKAKQGGANVVKQWDSTLDKRTRPTHQQLDGQIREINDPFEIPSNGRKSMYPGGFGIAAEDINCRCAILQRARWALDDAELQTLKDRAAYFGLDKTGSFNEFKTKYLRAVRETPEKNEHNKIELGELEVYGKKHAKAIRENLENAPEDIQRVWNDCVSDFHVLEPRYRGDAASYNPGYDGVKLNITNAGKGSNYQTPYQVVFHEYGHHTDYVLNRKYGDRERLKAFSETYKEGIFGKTLKKEANAALDEFGKTLVKKVDVDDLRRGLNDFVKAGLMTVDEVEEEIKNELKKAVLPNRDVIEAKFCEKIRSELSLIARSDISGMFEPVMNRGYPFGVGYGKNYWKKRDNGKEAFAEMFSAEVNNPESLEQIKKFFPESYKIFREMLEVVK